MLRLKITVFVVGISICAVDSWNFFANRRLRIESGIYGHTPRKRLIISNSNNECPPDSSQLCPVDTMNIREIKFELQRRGIDHRDLFEKEMLIQRLLQVRQGSYASLKAIQNRNREQTVRACSGNNATIRSQAVEMADSSGRDTDSDTLELLSTVNMTTMSGAQIATTDGIMDAESVESIKDTQPSSKRSRRKSKQRFRDGISKDTGAGLELNGARIMESMEDLYDAELRWAKSVSKAMRRSDLKKRNIPFAADATEEELAKLLAKANLPSISSITTTWYAKDTEKAANRDLFREDSQPELSKRKRKKAIMNGPQTEVLDQIERHAQRTIRKIVKRAALLTGLHPVKNFGGSAASWSISRIACVGTASALALGRWAGGKMIKADHILVLCAGFALITKRGLGGFLGSLLLVRLLRSALIETDTTDPEEEQSIRHEGAVGT